MVIIDKWVKDFLIDGRYGCILITTRLVYIGLKLLASDKNIIQGAMFTYVLFVPRGLVKKNRVGSDISNSTSC